jgi:hypothetical protein
MIQTPSMEYHNEVPRPSERMQLRSNPVMLSQESDNTITFGDTTATSIREERLLINLCSLLTTV